MEWRVQECEPSSGKSNATASLMRSRIDFDLDIVISNGLVNERREKDSAPTCLGGVKMFWKVSKSVLNESCLKLRRVVFVTIRAACPMLF